MHGHTHFQRKSNESKSENGEIEENEKHINDGYMEIKAKYGHEKFHFCSPPLSESERVYGATTTTTIKKKQNRREKCNELIQSHYNY